MKIVFLGTGTSVGVPVIGCNCPVCLSNNPRNKRRRTSLYIESANQHLLIDTSPDFRDQALTFNIRRIDAVLFTHSHADHIFGFDDIRRFNTIQKSVIPAYGSKSTINDLTRIFDYVQDKKVSGLYRPIIRFNKISCPFDLGDIHIEPLLVDHGNKPTLGFLFTTQGCSVAYIPDCKRISDKVIKKLKGIDVMILDALRHIPHITHLTIEESVNILQRINAKSSYIIHMCHDLDYEDTCKILPESVYMSYDGLTINPVSGI